MSALFCLFLCFRSYLEKLEVYTPTFYKIRYILEELYVAVILIIRRLIIYIDQLNTGIDGPLYTFQLFKQTLWRVSAMECSAAEFLLPPKQKMQSKALINGFVVNTLQ